MKVAAVAVAVDREGMVGIKLAPRARAAVWCSAGRIAKKRIEKAEAGLPGEADCSSTLLLSRRQR